MLNNDALNKLKEFRNKEGDMIIFLLENMAEDVENKYGKDVATGFVLALDVIYTALTGNELKDKLQERI